MKEIVHYLSYDFTFFEVFLVFEKPKKNHKPKTSFYLIHQIYVNLQFRKYEQNSKETASNLEAGLAKFHTWACA